MMMKREREFGRKIEALGFKIESTTQTGSSHLRFVIVSPDGRKIRVFAPLTPGDWRGERNSLAMLKRMLKAK